MESCNLKPAQIIDIVSSTMEVSIKDIVNKTRGKITCSDARKICMYALKQYIPDISDATIGYILFRDRSSVTTARKRTEELFKFDKQFKYTYSIICDKLNDLL